MKRFNRKENAMKSRVILVAIAILVLVVQPPHASVITGLAGDQPSQNASPTGAQRKAGEVVIEPASLNTPETGTVNFELGTLYVPENRADPKSRIIGVGFARFRAKQPSTAPPTFHLPGGPGDSYLRGLKQENRQLALWIKLIATYSRVGDVVFVDQRGNSERSEILKFKYRTQEEPLDTGASLARSTAGFVETARAAVAEFAAKGIDLRGYTVKDCADDVNDLRKALGYERITLVGTSFGSQWSFAVMRRHPEMVARALLSGVEPLDCGYDMPSHVFAAIQRMWWEAEKDSRLQPYLPQGGLMAATREVLRRLDRAPAKVKVKDSKTGETSIVTLGREDLQRSFIRGTAGPAFLLSLYYERYDSWASSTLAGRRSRDAEALMIGPLIDTSLGVTPRREYLLRTDAGASEFALVGVRRSRIQTLADGGNRRARFLLELVDNLNAYISATQLGITMASLALGWIGEPVFAHLLEAPLEGRVSDAVRHTIAFT